MPQSRIAHSQTHAHARTHTPQGAPSGDPGAWGHVDLWHPAVFQLCLGRHDGLWHRHRHPDHLGASIDGHQRRAAADRPRQQQDAADVAAASWTADLLRPNFRALLVDAAGTLLSPTEPAAAVYLRYGRKYGVALSEAEVLRRYRQAYSTPWAGSTIRYGGGDLGSRPRGGVNGRHRHRRIRRFALVLVGNWKLKD